MDPDDLKLKRLPDRLRLAAVGVGEVLADRGCRSWVVGGAVRDLAMGREPKEVDITTDAHPDLVEESFEETVPLGKRFGTVLVKWSGLGLEVTSLRAEAGYDDARRPEVIQFGTSVEEDATRRDFTCNAMYLDTQSGEFLDPVRGLDDIDAGRLRAVGEASVRFSEDGLRIFRLARFASVLNLQPTASTLEGARVSLDALRGVSGERILAELGYGLPCGRGEVMLEMLSELGVHSRLFPSAAASAGEDAASVAKLLLEPLSLCSGLLLFVDPDPLGRETASRAERGPAAREALETLRPSKALRREWASVWDLAASIERGDGADIGRGQLRLWMRQEAWDAATGLVLACARARGGATETLEGWRRERGALSDSELNPDPWINADSIRDVGFPPGPRWKELIEEGLRLQLAGEWSSRGDAQLWLREQLGS